MRQNYPADEQKYKWLCILFDTYAISDDVTDKLLKEASFKGIKIACSKGCAACCKRMGVPFTALELMGISWFVSEKISGPIRQLLKNQLREYESRTDCPFLVDNACSIYPVRPLVCRQFFMRGIPCKENEDISVSKQGDIIFPGRTETRKVAMKLLEVYGITNLSDKERAFESGFILAHSMQMHEYNWNRIVMNMDFYENKI